MTSVLQWIGRFAVVSLLATAAAVVSAASPSGVSDVFHGAPVRDASVLQEPAPAKPGAPAKAEPGSDAEPSLADQYSGMYSFLQEGEFVQLDFGDEGKLSGFVSRYGSLDSDRGAFLDHFFKSGTWKGTELSFQTQPVHGIWYEFKGHIQRGAAKTRAEEGYYVLKGTLTEYTTDAAKKTSGRARDITMKSFPQDAEAPKTGEK